MTPRPVVRRRTWRVWLLAAVALAACIRSEASGLGPADRTGTLPARLSGAELRALIASLSEPGGSFHSDNFTSNEPGFADAATSLATSGPHGGAYLGVGPEQNFDYILAVRPAIAFIIDIRQQAVMQHLLFKAIFELAGDRADFVSLLFSQPRPDGLDADSTIEEIWQAFPVIGGVDRERFTRNLAAIEARLGQADGVALTPAERASLEYVYQAFFTLGPAINYAGYATGLTTAHTNFAELTTAVDRAGQPRSFLGSARAFRYVKNLEARNLIVPVVGDFAGPRALRGIGDYLRAHGARVSTFYVSNVEQYLFDPRVPGGAERNGGWRAFYANVAALPIDASSVFIRVPFGRVASRSVAPRRRPFGGRPQVSICPIAEFLAAVAGGRVTNYRDARACAR